MFVLLVENQESQVAKGNQDQKENLAPKVNRDQKVNEDQRESLGQKESLDLKDRITAHMTSKLILHTYSHMQAPLVPL